MRSLRAVAALLLLLAVVIGAQANSYDSKGRNVTLRLIGAAALPAAEQVTFDPAESVAYLIGDTKLYVVDLSVSALGLQAQTTAKASRTHKKNTIVTANVANPSFGNTLPVLATLDFGVPLNDVFFCSKLKKRRGGILAIALNAPNKLDNGQVKILSRFSRSAANSLQELASFTVGALPDQLEFSASCETILVSNEGEPADPYNVTTDPVGSVSIIRLDCASSSGAVTGSVKTAGFEGFNDKKAQLQAAGVKIDGPGATVAQDVEPEYTTFLPGEERAIISLQENNAFAVLDVKRNRITDIIPLGLQNHGWEANAPDPSDKDGGIRINPYPGVFGLLQPDELKAFSADGVTYVVATNEGDTRVYGPFDEESRGAKLVKQSNFDTSAFTATQLAQLSNDTQLGRLLFLGIPVNGVNDVNDDGKIDRLTSFGSRSWSIWRIGKANGATTATRVFDSGDQFERLSAAELPAIFNSEGTTATFDGRSDNKGPEPEGVAIGIVGKRRYAFISTERLSVVFAYDLSDPTRPALTSYALPPQANAGDQNTRFRGPEGLTVASLRFNEDVEVPLLLAAYETNGGLGVFQLVSQS